MDLFGTVMVSQLPVEWPSTSDHYNALQLVMIVFWLINFIMASESSICLICPLIQHDWLKIKELLRWH